MSVALAFLLLNELTHYHTMPRFDTLKMYSCGKHCEKRRTLYGTYFSFLMHFKMSSAVSFNLNQSKILLSGNGLSFFPAKQSWVPSRDKLENRFNINFVI